MDALIGETNTNIKFQWKWQKDVLENMAGLKFWITGQCVVHWSNFCLVLVSWIYLIYSINKWTTHWIDQIKELLLVLSRFQMNDQSLKYAQVWHDSRKIKDANCTVFTLMALVPPLNSGQCRLQIIHWSKI